MAAQAMAMPAMPAMTAMPAATEWETHWTNEGTPYYYNKFTQQSVWEMPPEVMMSMMMPQMQIPNGDKAGRPGAPHCSPDEREPGPPGDAGLHVFYALGPVQVWG